MVANSGGSDSTCLLYLIHQLSLCRDGKHFPQKVLSLHVNHQLQPSSDDMAAACARNALRIGLAAHEHSAVRVNWKGCKPTDGPVEESARKARYGRLMNGLIRHRCLVLATGHHADDQLETSLLRLARGSQQDGATGMKQTRRWGMGENAEFGIEGMNRYIIRPLLEFSKVASSDVMLILRANTTYLHRTGYCRHASSMVLSMWKMELTTNLS